MAQIWDPVFDAALGQWTVAFTVRGRRIRRRLGIADPGDRGRARREAKRLHDAAWQAHFAEPDRPLSPPFWQAAEAYVQDGGEARFLPPLVRYFGPATTCSAIGPIEIAEAAVALYPGRARATIRRQVETPVSAVLRFAAGLRRRPTGDMPRTRWLTPEEAEALVRAAGRAAPLVAFLLGSGVRTGEAVAAEIADLNPATGQFRVRAEAAGAGKSQAVARFIRLAPRSLAAIATDRTAGALFLTPKGQPYRLRARGGGQFAAAFGRARAAAGLGPEVTPHVLRHTWATWAYAQHHDLVLLMSEGGWSKADMALRYTRLAPADLADRCLAFGWDFRQESGKSEPRSENVSEFRSLRRVQVP